MLKRPVHNNLAEILSLLAALWVTVPTGAQDSQPALKQADADYRAGAVALARNDLQTALDDLRNVVRIAPASEQGHVALAAVLLRIGRLDEATRELERALAIQPKDAAAQLNLALAYQQSGHANKSIPLFEQLQSTATKSQHPLSPQILAAYARSLAATGQIRAAVARMKQACMLDPHNAGLQNDLGTLYAQLQQWPDAETAFRSAVAGRPDFASAHLHLGLTLQALHKPGAQAELTRAYQLAPRDPLVALELGKFLAAAGQDEQALEVLKQAETLDPASTSASYQLGLVLERLGRAPDAIPLLQKAANANPQNAEALTNLGMALCLSQRAKEALPILARAIAIDPKNETALQNFAVADIQLSQIDDAIVQLRAALNLAPNASQLHYNLGYALKAKDDAADAIPELETAEKLDATSPEAPYLLGILYMQVARYADAETQLKLSLNLRPANGEGWATLGSVDNKLDKLTEAAAALKEAIRQSPLQADPHLTLATVLAKQGNAAEATEERRKAGELMREHMNLQRAEVSTHSADALLTAGNVNDAIVEFREALSYDPNYVEAHEGLAKALERQGQSMEAAVERQKIATLRQSKPQ